MFENKLIQLSKPNKGPVGRSLWVWLLPLSVYLMAFVLAPAPYIFLLNQEQKQCAMFWPGDEYVYYAPPKPWLEAKPDSNGMLQTEFGSCNYTAVRDGSISEENCCKNLGYTYIGEIKGVVEKRDYGLKIVQFLPIFGIPIVILVVGIFLIKQDADKQKTTGE